ncbi:acireductone dioxygenase, partial [Pseudoalteromonas sp. SIMBA_148]
NDGAQIASELEAEGIRFERWTAGCEMSDPTDQTQVLAAYADDVARLKSENGFVTADVIGLTPDHPDRDALRGKFLD